MLKRSEHKIYIKQDKIGYFHGDGDPGGSRDTHRTKRAYGSSKIKVARMFSNQSVDLVVLIATV